MDSDWSCNFFSYWKAEIQTRTLCGYGYRLRNCTKEYVGYAVTPLKVIRRLTRKKYERTAAVEMKNDGWKSIQENVQQSKILLCIREHPSPALTSVHVQIPFESFRYMKHWILHDGCAVLFKFLLFPGWHQITNHYFELFTLKRWNLFIHSSCFVLRPHPKHYRILLCQPGERITS